MTIGVRTVTLLKNKAGCRDGNGIEYSYFIKGKIGLKEVKQPDSLQKGNVLIMMDIRGNIDGTERYSSSTIRSVLIHQE